jgi:hypothetical protein
MKRFLFAIRQIKTRVPDEIALTSSYHLRGKRNMTALEKQI